MSEILLETQSVPAAPSAGQDLFYPDSISNVLAERNNVRPRIIGGVRNSSIAAQAFTTTEIYLTGSSLPIPSHLMQVKMRFRWRIVATKTAGTGALIWRVRVGVAGTTADTERLNFTQVSSPTSATDTGMWDIDVVVRSIGAAGVIAGGLRMNHVLATTGWSSLGTNVQFVASAAFDTTVANLIVGVTFNHQTAGAGNIELVQSELVEANF